MSDDPFSDFLYPFLDNHETDTATAVLAQVAESTRQKAAEVIDLRRRFFAQQGDQLAGAAQLLAEALAGGGQLLTMGNGGSATDAQDMAADLLNPGPGRRSWPAISLTNDIGVVTAVGNDVGFDNVFARQVIAFGRAGDVAVGFSTSGRSRNVLVAFDRARQMGLKTIGITGYDGGEMVEQALDYCFVVRSTYVPRIQEVQATIYHTLLALTMEILAPVAERSGK